jgi:antitoxin ParD1/3/4
MNESLPSDVQAFVKQAIASGDYASEDEVLAQAVRVLKEVTDRHQALRGDIQVAIDEIDRGEGKSWNADEIKAELDKELDANTQTN